MLKTDYERQSLSFFISTLNWVRRFGYDVIRLSSKPGKIMHPFEPQLSLQGAFHGKLSLSVCSNRACKGTDKANFLIGGVQLVVQGTDR